LNIVSLNQTQPLHPIHVILSSTLVLLAISDAQTGLLTDMSACYSRQIGLNYFFYVGMRYE